MLRGILTTAVMMEESTLAETVRKMAKMVRAFVLTRLKQKFPGVNLSLMVSIKTLEPSLQAKGTTMSMVEPFSRAEGITMIVIDPFSQAICTLLRIVGPFSQVNSACPIQINPATSMRAERLRGRRTAVIGTLRQKIPRRSMKLNVQLH